MSKQNLIPLGSRVILKRLEAKSQTSSGLHIPESAKETPLKASVIAVGDTSCDDKDNATKNIDIKIDDIVIVPKWAGTEIKLDNETFIVAKLDEILCKVQS